MTTVDVPEGVATPSHPDHDVPMSSPLRVQAVPPGRRTSIFALAVFCVAIVPYLRATQNQFISYDDPIYVTDEPMVKKGLTVDGIVWAFSGFRFFNYHPLTWLTHMMDVELFGLNPAGHHFTSIVLHALTATLLFLLLLRLTAETWPSAFVAALFAVHPTHVESVAWVAERKDVLCAFFAMLTLLAYVGYVQRPSAARYVLIVIVFALGLLSKQMIVTLPCVMLLLDYWPLRRISDRKSALRALVEKIPLLALSATASVVIAIAQASGQPMKSLEQFPFDRRLANALNSFLNYLWMTVWPSDLSVFYPYPSAFSTGWLVLAAAVLVGVTAAAIVQAKRKPYLAVGWFWFAGMLVPVIGLVQVGRQGMADRYTYLPHIGLFIAVVWLVKEIASRHHSGRRTAAVVGGLLVIALAARTWHQIGYWKTSVTLFTHALSVTERNPVAHNQLGNEYARTGRIDDAERHYRACIAIDPEYSMAYVNLAKVHLRRDEEESAYLLLLKAREFPRPSSLIHLMLGLIHERRGDVAQAEADFRRASEIDPDSLQAYLRRGYLLQQQGRQSEAAEQYRAALRVDPESKDAKVALESLWRKQ